MKSMSVFGKIVMVTVVGLLFTSCAKQGDSEKKATNQPATEQTASAQTCELKFEEKFSNADKDNKTVSFYVENFAEEGDCWKKVEDYASTVSMEKGKNAKVFFFNCPHHTTEVKASDFKLDPEYQSYCVARLDVTPDGKKTFNKMPYDKKKS
jgi:hypothetical protein